MKSCALRFARSSTRFSIFRKTRAVSTGSCCAASCCSMALVVSLARVSTSFSTCLAAAPIASICFGSVGSSCSGSFAAIKLASRKSIRSITAFSASTSTSTDFSKPAKACKLSGACRIFASAPAGVAAGSSNSLPRRYSSETFRIDQPTRLRLRVICDGLHCAILATSMSGKPYVPCATAIA